MLNDAARHVAARAAADEPASPLAAFRPWTKEEREQHRRRDLLEGGLRRLREGMAPTKAQMPEVQRYLQGIDEELRQAKQAVATANAAAATAERHLELIVPMWNAVVAAIRSIGIIYYEQASKHGWHGEVDGIIEEHAGYNTEAEALKAALAWRIEQAKKGHGI